MENSKKHSLKFISFQLFLLLNILKKYSNCRSISAFAFIRFRLKFDLHKIQIELKIKF